MNIGLSNKEGMFFERNKQYHLTTFRFNTNFRKFSFSHYEFVNFNFRFLNEKSSCLSDFFSGYQRNIYIKLLFTYVFWDTRIKFGEFWKTMSHNMCELLYFSKKAFIVAIRFKWTSGWKKNLEKLCQDLTLRLGLITSWNISVKKRFNSKKKTWSLERNRLSYDLTQNNNIIQKLRAQVLLTTNFAE